MLTSKKGDIETSFDRFLLWIADNGTTLDTIRSCWTCAAVFDPNLWTFKFIMDMNALAANRELLIVTVDFKPFPSVLKNIIIYCSLHNLVSFDLTFDASKFLKMGRSMHFLSTTFSPWIFVKNPRTTKNTNWRLKNIVTLLNLVLYWFIRRGFYDFISSVEFYFGPTLLNLNGRKKNPSRTKFICMCEISSN